MDAVREWHDVLTKGYGDILPVVKRIRHHALHLLLNPPLTSVGYSVVTFAAGCCLDCDDYKMREDGERMLREVLDGGGGGVEAVVELCSYLRDEGRHKECGEVVEGGGGGRYYMDGWQTPGYMQGGLMGRPWWDGQGFGWVSALEERWREVSRLAGGGLYAGVGEGGRGHGHDSSVLVGRWVERVVFDAAKAGGPEDGLGAMLREVLPAHVVEFCEKGGGRSSSPG